jgi:hypothetical protein
MASALLEENLAEWHLAPSAIFRAAKLETEMPPDDRFTSQLYDYPRAHSTVANGT